MELNFDCAVLTAAQIHAADARAAQMGIRPYELMQEAGNALATAILQRFPQSRALIICGPGNNGGDGFVLACALQQRGWDIEVASADGRRPRHPPACEHASRWREPLLSFGQLCAQSGPPDHDVIIDAGFGVGLDRPLSAQWQNMIDYINAADQPVIAIDLPTGIADTGQLLCSRPVRAELTLTLFKKKLAHLFMPARSFCGEVQVCDIGLSAEMLAGEHFYFENTPTLWQHYWQQTRPGHQDHKYRRGHVLVVGGTLLPGAAALSAFGAAYSGAGLVSLLCESQSWAVYAAQMRSIMVRCVDTLADFQSWVSGSKTNGVVLGPGALDMPQLPAYLEVLLERKKPCVLDAEALNIMAKRADHFLPKLHKQCILTPHAGEFERLFGPLCEHNGRSIAQRVREAAQRCGAVVLLKGAQTLIADPTGSVVINTEASPYLATAGSGDVLAGVIATFLSQGVPPLLAAAMAVWLHGHAGKLAGPGLIADDLPRLLVDAQHSLVQQLAGQR